VILTKPFEARELLQAVGDEDLQHWKITALRRKAIAAGDDSEAITRGDHGTIHSEVGAIAGPAGSMK
jgi:hypothetical protein